MVLAELLTGQKAIRLTASRGGESLVSWFLRAFESSNLDDVLAEQVAKAAKQETGVAIAELAKRCLNMDGKQRPTMREVALEVEVISQRQCVPVSCPKNQQDAVDQTLNEMTECAIDGILPPCTSFTEEDYSLPSN